MEVPMQEKGSRSRPLAEEDETVERAIMRLLVEDRGLLTFGEINAEVGRKTLLTADALARLKQGRLVHECMGFTFAARAAVVSGELWGLG
jgi:hypothetical protein